MLHFFIILMLMQFYIMQFYNEIYYLICHLLFYDVKI